MRTGRTRRWLARVVLMATLGECATVEAGPPPCELRAFLLVEPDVLTTGQQDVVREEVSRIWRRYGLTIDWRTVPGPFVNGTVSVMVRDTFQNAAKARRFGGVAVAWTIFGERGPLPLIRASVASARLVAAGARVGGRDVVALPETMQERFIAQVIGRSIAHEIGHYVLGRGHTGFGLMREMIPPDDYFGAPGLFTLTRPEVAALRRSAVWQTCTAEAQARVPAGP